MSDLRTSIVLSLTGNLEARARRYGSAVGQFAGGAERQLGRVARSAAALGRGLDALGNKYTAMLGGVSAAGTAKMLADLQLRFTRLGIQAGVSDEAVQNLKKSIYDVALAPDIRADPSEITSAIEAIVEMTGDLGFAQENIRNIGVAIQATGVAGADIGGLFAEFQKMDIKAPDEVLRALDTLNQQGKIGAFTLRDLAGLGPRVITAYTAMGRGGTDALLEMGAALQMVRRGTGNSEQAATAFEATMRTLRDPTKLKALRKAGIQVFDPERLKAGQRVLRPINELMAEIIERTRGDSVKMGSIFDAEAIRAFNQAAGEFQRTGALGSLDTFMAVQGDGTTTLADSARAASKAASAMTALMTAWKQVMDEELSSPIQAAADALNALGPENTGRIIKGIAGVGVALGGLVLARKAWTMGRGAWSFLRGGKGGGGGAATGLGGLPVPLPVYVVNSRMSLLPGEYGGGYAGGAAGGAKGGRSTLGKRGGRVGRLLARFGGMGRYAGRLGGAASIVAAGVGLADVLTDDSLTGGEKTTAAGGYAGGAAGGALGGWGGAALGAAIGTAILPGIGTAVGGALGGLGGSLAGYLGGEWGGAKLAEWFAGGKGAEPEPAQASVLVSISDDRVRVKRMEAQGMDLDVDTGVVLGGVGR
ncbi:tail tape measure protein [Desulfocurvus vexinensis]|uniref:tail tape measure protein n=1 Tax=Desulfocurvus vexinensis TaxID=399548 RepID=UPI0004912DBD|nr:tail tape measure protein [Desulfocurvus vexinensis]